MDRSAKYLKSLVGASGFEPETSCAQGRRARSSLPRNSLGPENFRRQGPHFLSFLIGLIHASRSYGRNTCQIGRSLEDPARLMQT